jgi:SAM-dependent methyltransferase
MSNPDDFRCAVCGGRQLRQVHASLRATRFSVARCDDCGLEMLLPQPSWDDIRAMYDASYYKAWGMAETENDAVAHMKKSSFAHRLRELARWVPSGKLLDLGTASGFLLEAARDAGYDPYGVELSEYAAGLARKKFGDAHIWNGTLETCPFERHSFAAITMCDFIEHLPDPVATLALAREFLAPGGIALIVTPDTGSLTHQLMGRRWTHYKIEHLCYFNRTSMTRAADRAGFSVASFHRAAKRLSLRYVNSQLHVYRHWLLTPAVAAAHGIFFFARDLPVPITIGEFAAVLRPKA